MILIIFCGFSKSVIFTLLANGPIGMNSNSTKYEMKRRLRMKNVHVEAVYLLVMVFFCKGLFYYASKRIIPLWALKWNFYTCFIDYISKRSNKGPQKRPLRCILRPLLNLRFSLVKINETPFFLLLFFSS